MINAINHITVAVRDLDISFSFYTDLLGLRPIARWYKGAYLTAGDTWVCLTLDPNTRIAPLTEYTHLAFSVSQDNFGSMVARLQESDVTCWQQNHSYGDSFYFLDPSGHKLEIHTSDLQARIEALKSSPPRDLVLFT